MKRLRQIQGVFIVFQDRSFGLVNVTDDDIDNVQVVSDRPFDVDVRDGSMVSYGRTLVIKTLPKNSVRLVRASDRVVFSHKNSFAVGKDRHITRALPFGELMINLDVNDWQIPGGGMVQSGTFLLKTVRGGTGIPILSNLPYGEELDLILDQTALIAREVLLRGRSLNIERFLDSSRQIPLENPDNW